MNKTKGIKYTKRIRLKDFDYKGSHRYFITICTDHKKSCLNDPEWFDWLVKVLQEKSIKFGFKVWAYCFMPDHLYLLVEGKDEKSDLKKFIASYKQISSYQYKKSTGRRLWQSNYYERVLRNEETTQAVINYIFCNPVRRGLVENFKDFEFLGSFDLDIKQM